MIGNLEVTGNDLVKLSGPGEGSSSIEDKVATCLERYERLQRQTEERGIKIGMTLAQEEELQNRLDELQALLERRKEEFGNLKPISVRPDKIRAQIEEIKVGHCLAMERTLYCEKRNYLLYFKMTMKTQFILLWTINMFGRKLFSSFRFLVYSRDQNKIFPYLFLKGLQSEFDPEKELVEEVRPLVTALVNVNPDTKTSLLMKDKMSKVSTLAADTQTLYDERLKALELALDAGEKFWTGLDEIKNILKDVQDHLDSEELPAADLEVLEEQIHDHQVRN